MSKHTPGQWSFDYGFVPPDGPERYCQVTVDGGNTIIADVNELYNKEEGHANGRLIAEAPAMLDALKKVFGELHFLTKDERCDHTVGICWCECHRALEEAKEVIARAEGKE